MKKSAWQTRHKRKSRKRRTTIIILSVPFLLIVFCLMVAWYGMRDEKSAQEVQSEEKRQSVEKRQTMKDLIAGLVKENNENKENDDDTENDEMIFIDWDSVKRLSILGDSLSTFEGWIPEGYSIFFPFNGEVTDVEQTWWKMLLYDMGMELCANSSSSGSTCVGYSLSTDNPRYACSDYRIAALASDGEIEPDLIIVYMGTNDFVTSVPVGENDGTEPVEEGMIENFSDAYSLMLDKLNAAYPSAQVFCCTLPQIGDWGTEQPFVPFVNGLGLRVEDYNSQIEIIAGTKGCSVIDLQPCGITTDNMINYVTDGVHFNPEGMKLIRDAVKTALEQSGY